jgi:hypothetical protein
MRSGRPPVPQSGGFGGFVAVQVEPDAENLAPSHGPRGSGPVLDGDGVTRSPGLHPNEGDDLVARVDELLELVDVALPGLKPIAPALSESLEAVGGGSYGHPGLGCD